MTEIFLKILNMSISATWLVLIVLAARLCLKKAPKWIHVLLWGIVAVRLLCPVSIESALSLIPSAEVVSPDIMMDPTPQITTGIPAINSVVNPIIAESFAPEPMASANPLQIWIPVAGAVWIAGMAVMALYTAVSYFRLRRRVRTATRLYGNIFQSAHIPSPFVLGIIRPKVYLPYGMKEGDMAHVIAHEQTHIRRKDHWWKPLGFGLLTLHWFNPFLWLAYILLCRDIELACDEKVIAQLGRDKRADYSQALLTCSVNRRMIAACPLAFGEVGVKQRVKNVLSYKKPAFWVIVLAVILCGVVAVCFLTDPEPSREFAMEGNNVADLDPEAIVERILDIEDLKYSNVYMNSLNFSLYVDSDFNWMNSQAVRYFFGDDNTIYSSQLRIYPEDETYFLTEPSQWHEQERIFLLRHYLDAVKYLPQHEIQQLAPADQYIITHIDGGMPADYDRVITYSPAGVQELEGWFIHLELQPATETGGAYHGTAEDVIHLFYGDGQGRTTTSMITWIDDAQMDIYNLAEQTIRLPEFEGVTFHYHAPASLTAEDRTGETPLIQGMPIWNVFFTDVTGDGMPDVCATVSFGSGLVDSHVVVYDYANAQEYTLWDRGVYDYYLRVEDGKLLCDQYEYPSGGPMDRGTPVASGELIMAEAGGGGGKRLTIDFRDIKPGGRFIVDIVDRTVTEGLPTDEAVEVFWEDADYFYSFPSIRSHLVVVTYNNGNSEDIKTALEAGRAAVIDLDRFGIQYYTEPKTLPMEPTRTNLRGLVAGYLFTPINGATYRYALAEVNPENVTADLLLDTFTEETAAEGIAWEVYSLKEYPDKTKVLLISAGDVIRLYEYAPARQAGEGALEAARAAGYVIVEDGTLTENADAWLDFYAACQEGKPGSIRVAHSYTLDPDRTVPSTYEAYQQDYPALYILELTYDGEDFVLRTEDGVTVYKYLMKYTVSGTPLETSAEHEIISHYVLTHDDTHTWDQLWSSLASSVYGAAIDHVTVCTEYKRIPAGKYWIDNYQYNG